MAHFDELMQRALTVRNNVAPSSNTAILVGGVLVSIVSALQLLLDTKQGTLTFDDEPTDGSTNPVTSDGIYEAIADAIASIDLSACEKIVNKVTALSAQSTDVQYPTAKCVYDALQAIDLSACEKIVNKVTSLSAQSTDTQYPSAKCVYDALQAIDLSACEKIVNKVTSLSAQSTDTQYPSAKCVYDALQAIDLSVYELLANKVTSLSAQSTDTQYPSAKCVYDALQAIDLSACEKIVNKVTSLSAQSTDTQYPSAKCVYDAIQSINLSAYELIANKVTALTAQATDTQYPSAKAVYDCCIAVQAALQSLDERVTRLESFHYVTYYIRGTSTNVNGTETFTIQMLDLLLGTYSNVTFTAEVDANGDWEVEYKGKKIRQLAGVFKNNATITTIEFTEEFDECQNIGITNSGAFQSAAVTSVSFPNATFENLTVAQFTFYGCSQLLEVSMPLATFKHCTSIFRMFQTCTVLQVVNLPLATFESVTDAVVFMAGCSGLNSVVLSAATFESVTDATQMFYQAGLASLSLPNATFKSVNRTERTFASMVNVVEISIPLATFESNTNTAYMFMGDTKLERIIWPNLNFSELVSMSAVNAGIFQNCNALNDSALTPFSTQALSKVTSLAHAFGYCRAITKINFQNFDSSALTTTRLMLIGCNSLVELDLSAATFDKVTDVRQTFDNCTALTIIKTPTNSTAISTTATTSNIPLNLRWSPLTYQSMLNVANWLSNFTGYSAPTITFRAASWNALTAAEQSNIDTILSGKNWTRAIA